MRYVKKLWPLALILVIMIVTYFLGLWDYLSFESLKENKLKLEQFLAKYPILAPTLYLLLYVITTMLSIPSGFILTLIGGFLWPQPWSTLLVVVGATIGASILFLAARHALHDFFASKTGPFLEKMRHGFQEGQISYMLFLRLVPLFPFWIVNLAPAFFDVRFFHYVWTTLVGVLPGTFVLAQAGRGLSAILESDEGFTVGAFFNFQMKIALVGLAVISLIPIIIKKFRKKKDLK